MNTKHIYVISDIHLGGAPDVNGISFQMCPPESRRRLARFIHYITEAHPGDATQLVINGDFIDFLAEERISSDTISVPISESKRYQTDAFTKSQSDAVLKLQRVIRQTDEGANEGERVFGALQQFLANGHRLTILLGNHHLELSLPAVRHELYSALHAGPSRIEFLYDGEALTLNDVLIEHGNRYDGFNAVEYGALRAFRSAISRGEQPLDFSPPPGARMVARIMNDLKARYRFLDLLKPETEAAIPLLIALEPAVLKHVALAGILKFQAWRAGPAAGQIPEKEAMVADSHDSGVLRHFVDPEIIGDVPDEALVRRTRYLLEWSGEHLIDEHVRATLSQVADNPSGWPDSIHGAWQTFKRYGSLSNQRARLLRKGFRKFREVIESTFDVSTESSNYLTAAKRLSQGKRVIVFGHTHLPKSISLPPGGRYLNSGTWCPTVRLPTDMFTSSESDEIVLPAINEFISDLAENRMEKWTDLKTTFVRIDMNGPSPGLYEFKKDSFISQIG